MNTFYKQFIRNMAIGITYSALWYYIFYKIFESFWWPTILTNIVAFFVGRYYIFRETSGVKLNEKRSVKKEVRKNENL